MGVADFADFVFARIGNALSGGTLIARGCPTADGGFRTHPLTAEPRSRVAMVDYCPVDRITFCCFLAV
jgi:hypothetical protein